MCVGTCVKISDKSDKKLRSYRSCNFSSWVMRGEYKIGQAHDVSKLLIFSLEDTLYYSYHLFVM